MDRDPSQKNTSAPIVPRWNIPPHFMIGPVLGIVASFVAVLPCLSQPETIEFERLTIQEGLSNNRINAILQDKKGFMWFGTEGGLNRWDGYTVTPYGHLPMYEGSVLYEDRHGLLWLTAGGGHLYRFDRISEKFIEYPAVGNRVHTMHEDSFGELWVATRGDGLARYLPGADSFRIYRHHTESIGSLPDDNVGAVFEDRERQLWIGDGGGLSRYGRDQDIFLRLEQGPDCFVSAMAEDNNGWLWVGTNHGLWGIGSARTACEAHANTAPAWDDIICVFADSRGDLWVGSRGGISRYDRVTRDFRNFESYLPPEVTLGITWSALPILEDKNGTIWSGVSSVLARYDRVKQDFELCSYDPGKPRYLEAEVTSTMYEDRSGRLWFGTMSRGVEWTDRLRKQFHQIPLNDASPSVISIHRDAEGILWLGKPDGLSRVDLASGAQRHYMPDNANENSLSGNVIACIAEESPRILWLGTYERGLNRFDKVTGRCTQFLHNPHRRESLSSNNIGSVYVDGTGTLWVGTDAGLDRFNPGSGGFTHYPDNSIEGAFVTCLLEDKAGALWVGTSSGLARFDRKLSTFEHFRHDSSLATSLSNNAVNTLHEDSHSGLWIGTDYGLNRLDRNAGIFSHVTVNDGLASDKIIGILEDNRESLWLLTSKGISRYTPATRSIRNYDARDGVRLDAALYTPYLKDGNGEMFFGGYSGLIRFNPDSIMDNLNVPSIVLTAFKKQEQQVKLDTAISEKKMIQLSYKDNVFSFEFAALNFVSGEKNQYAYRLEGFDEDWVYAGTKRTATYTNLDGGSYIFRVKGSNNDGLWNEVGTSIAVIISPPPWKTTWAYLTYILVAGGALYGIRRYQINKLKARHELEMISMESTALKEVDQVKSRFFANISHEFRTPLTLILGPVESMLAAERDEKSRQDIGMIQRNARRLLSLVNQLLDLSRIEAHRMKLSVREMDIVELVRDVAALFESLAARRSIQLSVTWSEPIVGYFDSDVVEKILTNLLSNALKFTREGGQVSVTVQRLTSPSTVGRQVSSTNGEEATITVSDTGVGISSDQLERIFDRFYQVDGTQTREHEGTGIGLALTRELVQLQQGHISVSSEPGRGSTFTIRLPLGKEHLTQDEITAVPVQPASTKSAVTHVHGKPADTMEPVENVDDESSDQNPIVLVIDDNKDMRRYIRDRLKVLYTVIEADNGAVGLKEATTAVPDLIVSDVMMPKLDGMELCRRLKDDVRTSHIPIILLTAKAGTDHRIEGFQTGADDYLVKPFEADELAARIANLIEQRRLLRERFRHEIVLKPRDITVTPVDGQFLNRVMTIVEEHMADSDLDTDAMARELFLSRMQLHRKLKALTGQSPHDFLRAMRLQRASELLRHGAGNVTEIAYEVGFNNLSHFAKSFREQFGKSPSEFAKDLPDPDR